jgi:hypothetical protein
VPILHQSGREVLELAREVLMDKQQVHGVHKDKA